MGRPELEAAGFSLVKLGSLVAIISCGLPFWRVMRFSEETSIWEGMWVLCEANGLKNLKCMPYTSHLELPQDLQVSRVLVVICIIISYLCLLLYMIGDERMSCVSNVNDAKKIKMAASGLFLGAGLLLLVSASWVTHNVILGITNPQMVFPWKPEMGASLYLGWLSSLLLLLGGALLGGAHLRCQGPSNNDQPSVFEGFNNEQPSDFEGSNNDQSSVFEGFNNDQASALRAPGKSPPPMSIRRGLTIDMVKLHPQPYEPCS
ncbi:claudin-4-like [Peromyscus californicus insignis]|uniref:claudin-4-like n=1 Tax=Peromyscus californicus insignis TaxID=564181 RepID=UPI0022A6E7AE|nr:claudin-4-like [Peromyscus californicus insignis]